MDYLYIDADEDHVSLQYIENKGGIVKPRSNTSMPKISYVYEGVERFWNEVYDYILATYDINTIKRIYISGEGASWIKSGRKWISGSTMQK